MSNQVFTADDVIREYYETYDLDKFKVLNGNRVLKKAKVNDLVRGIETEGYHLSIATVNKKGEVTDGQNRLAALKILRDKGILLPFRYAISEDANLRTCIALNSHSTNWDFGNFITAGALDENNPNQKAYIRLQELCNAYKGIPSTLIASLALNEWQHGRRKEIVKNEEFTFVRPQTTVERELTLLSLFQDVRDQFPNFEYATLAILFVINFLKKNKTTLHRHIKDLETKKTFKATNPKGVVEIMEKVFYKNHDRKEIIPWSTIYDFYIQGKTLKEINEFASKSSAPVEEEPEDMMEPEPVEAKPVPKQPVKAAASHNGLINMKNVFNATRPTPNPRGDYNLDKLQ